MSASSIVIPFPHSGVEGWIEGYRYTRRSQKDAAIVDAYVHILYQFTQWIAERPGHWKHFELTHLTEAR